MSSSIARKLVEQNVNLPTLPTVFARVNELIQNPNSGAAEVGRAIAQDTSMSSKVLRIANSAQYGLQERVISLEHASAVLGMRILRNIVLQASVIGAFEGVAKTGELDLSSLWKHAILCAQMCSATALRCTMALGMAADEFYSCGLLHDLGKIVLLDGLEETYVEVLRESRHAGRSLHEAEAEHLGIDHAEVGADLAARWSLPPGVVNAIRYHHGPAGEIACDPAVALVDLMNRMCTSVADGDDAARDHLSPETSAQLGLSSEEYARLVDRAVEALPRIEV